ncbi:Protein of unknown function [Gryllus bimaculatus]|nr:Protein of unknown function [Gryllus bimaculatus]
MNVGLLDRGARHHHHCPVDLGHQGQQHDARARHHRRCEHHPARAHRVGDRRRHEQRQEVAHAQPRKHEALLQMTSKTSCMRLKIFENSIATPPIKQKTSGGAQIIRLTCINPITIVDASTSNINDITEVTSIEQYVDVENILPKIICIEGAAVTAKNMASICLKDRGALATASSLDLRRKDKEIGRF